MKLFNKKADKVKCEMLADGTLVIHTKLYQKVKRVLVEYKTSGTLYYADNMGD